MLLRLLAAVVVAVSAGVFLVATPAMPAYRHDLALTDGPQPWVAGRLVVTGCEPRSWTWTCHGDWSVNDPWAEPDVDPVDDVTLVDDVRRHPVGEKVLTTRPTDDRHVLLYGTTQKLPAFAFWLGALCDAALVAAAVLTLAGRSWVR